MEECIPKKVLPSRRNLPWLNKDVRSAMRKRNTIFKKAGYSAKFRSARIRVIGMLCRAKANYFKNLNPRDSKQFWKAVKYLNKQQSTITTLQHDEQTDNTDLQKAELLNTFFSTTFNKSHQIYLLHSRLSHQHHPNMIPPLTKCTVPSLKLNTYYVQGLEVSKACGPDKISAQMLKYSV